MANTLKQLTRKDADQAIKSSYNEVDASQTISGFVVGLVGRKVECVIDDDTEVYTFTENGVQLYELTIVYTDSTRETFVSAERTA